MASSLADQVAQLSGSSIADRLFRDQARLSALANPYGSALARAAASAPPSLLGKEHFGELVSVKTARIPPPPVHFPRDFQRDADKFYWKKRPAKLDKHWEFECGIFRHHIRAESWIVPVVVTVDDLSGGAVEVKIHARNLSRPKEFSFPVQIRIREEDTESIVRLLLPEAMHS